MTFDFYVAANYTRDLTRAQRIIDALHDAGHHCTLDWTRVTPEAARILGGAMIAAARNAEVLILVWSDPLLGALLETGAALAAGRPVYVIGEPRDSVFWRIPAVTIVRDESELFNRLETPTWEEVCAFLIGEKS